MGDLEMEFKEHKILDEIRVVFKDGKLDIKEMKIYKGEKELLDEEGYYRNKAQEYFDTLISKDTETSFPFLKYPSILECLGVRPASPIIEIKEGLIRVSYDMKVKTADVKCLFPEPKSTLEKNIINN